LTKETFAPKYKDSFPHFPKLRNKVVNVCGDLYYKQMSEEETFEKAFKWENDDDAKLCKDFTDIDEYVEDNINQKLPLDGPQWRCYAHKFTDENGKDYVIQKWKCHHSLMDGISAMASMGYAAIDYSRDHFIKVKDVTLLQQLLLKISAPFYVPLLLIDTMFSGRDKNIMTKNKKNLTGLVNCSSNKGIDMQSIKDLSKKLGISINDLIMSATSVTLKEYFRINGDPIGLSDKKEELSVFMPANIRYSLYKEKKDVKIENKFAAVPLKMPLISDMKNSYSAI